MLKKIIDKNILLAFVIKKEFNKDGINFFTDSDSALQLAFIKKPKHSRNNKHLHPKYERIINQRTEFVYVRKGELYLKFYNNDKKFIEGCSLKKGDSVLICDGGHSIEYIEESEIIELRLGPYNEKNDKRFF